MIPARDDLADPRVEIQSRLARASNYNRWIVGEARPYLGARVLDAGCGTGNLSELLLEEVDEVVGVDEWPAMVEATGRRLARSGHFTAIQSDLTSVDLPARLASRHLDSAICANVLEHIEDDARALTTIGECLAPGSAVFVVVPAFMALYGAHDEHDHHLRRYTRGSFAAVVARTALHLEHTHYMNLPGFFAWFALGRMLRRTLDETSISLYDRVVPCVRAVESRVRPPFGQSLVAVLRT